jgi:hypothetical protein
LTRIVGLLAIWALLMVLVVFEMEHAPKTALGWVLLVAGGPPLLVALEWVSGRVSKAELDRFRSVRFSFTHAALALVALLIVLVLLAL